MAVQKMIMDGNKAAAYVAYAFTEVAAIYPITPSTPLSEHCDAWSAQGVKNIFGDTMTITELQSEAGAAGAVHGSLQAGAITTTFTASQGLLLMIPNMYKIAGELLPTVFHIPSRTVATHALSIYGDHSDVMACRQIGWAMLCSNSVQEAHDYALVSHLATLKTQVPFMHFFDGFRTSHEIQKVEVLEYDDYKKLANFDHIDTFRKRGLSPDRPVTRGTAQTPDIYFQAFEARNPYYENLADVIQETMDEVSKVLGRELKTVEYHGADDAEHIIILMGSMASTAKAVVDTLFKKGEKVAVIAIHLYRPFPTKHLLSNIPQTVQKIAVIDRCKELGSTGEPLYLDVCEAFSDQDRHPVIVGGRGGLSSKDVTPGQILAVFENLSLSEPKNDFTIGIVDDVSFKSLPSKYLSVVPEGTIECKFYGIGSDGTVGANKNSISIIGDNTDLNIQAYFDYDSKKSGGYTISNLRFGKEDLNLPYLIQTPSFISCSVPSYIYKYDLLKGLRDGGSFLLNTSWSVEEIDEKLPNHIKRYLAEHNINFYIINANATAREIGMRQSNTILQSAFFKLANILPYEKAVELMKKSAHKSYIRKGEAIVEMNYKAIDAAAEKLQKIEVKAKWKNLEGDFELTKYENAPIFVQTIAAAVNQLEGESLPVSAFSGEFIDGTVMSGSTRYEKRYISDLVPAWIEDNCIQCNQCAFVCPHAVIRPFLLTNEEKTAAPKDMTTLVATGATDLQYKISVSVADCTGCSACVDICPGKSGNKALAMEAIAVQEKEQVNYDWLFKNCKPKNPFGKNNAKAVQFEQPLFEFHAACPGCGETPYIKLVTQLFGDRMMIANTTGCTSIYGGSMPSTPYSANDQGHGPTWANSLFEDNAEFGFGMYTARKKLRERAIEYIKQAITEKAVSNIQVFQEWLDLHDDSEKTREVTANLKEALKTETSTVALKIRELQDYLVKSSMWLFGGDGWAYDIGFGGLDHVLSNNENINVLVLDTEVYSNTGGQASKSTPLGAQALFAHKGKPTAKKNLGLMMATYGHIYVGQISMGANKAHALKVMQEAESFPGPSLIIAYSPCIAHGLKGGLTNAQSEEKLAVDSGYWHLWRYNPSLVQEGKNPFLLDSGEPKFELFQQFIGHEVRFSALGRSFPEMAKELFDLAELQAKDRYKHYKRLSTMDYSL
ncbi:MAG: pyruvate:ferredoxin (flavodoxin) oxidoreductase [Brevinema sp.]